MTASGPLFLLLSFSHFPSLVLKQKAHLKDFPKLFGVRREAVTQHCPLCMHGSSGMQAKKRDCWGGGEEGFAAAALEPWLKQARLYG